ncbi:hypothetical protein GCM10023189_19660 [Nibrella saemangeumensis]|uniref:Caspase family p20 domain-containing protein n=1 Tax=Nibrella saemangeumensis TaxID=1084526 RepID=A0ABP8MSI3_9BACT
MKYVFLFLFGLIFPACAQEKQIDTFKSKSKQLNTSDLFSDPKPPSSSEKRLALVIGNGSYPGISQLTNAVTDAQEVARSLEEIGFEVMLRTDLNKQGINQAIRDFNERLADYPTAMFYYTGHGVQHEGINYLVPVDADPHSEADITKECEPVNHFVAMMEEARTGTNIVVLDASYTNPFTRSLGRGAGTKGLASMMPPQGTYIAYATTPGQTAASGSGSNGLYTQAFVKAIKFTNLTIEEVFKRVRQEVTQKSDRKQTPWESSALVGEFYFIRQALIPKR